MLLIPFRTHGGELAGLKNAKSGPTLAARCLQGNAWRLAFLIVVGITSYRAGSDEAVVFVDILGGGDGDPINGAHPRARRQASRFIESSLQGAACRPCTGRRHVNRRSYRDDG